MTLAAPAAYEGWIVQSANESLGPYVDIGFISAGDFIVPTTGAAEFYRLADPSYSIYSLNTVGYVNRLWPGAGYILINNPLDGGGNTLSSLFSSLPASFAGGLEGAKVQLWDPVANDYSATSYYLGSGSWSIDYSLPPGIGARLYSPVAYTNTYVGEALTGDGVPLGSGESITPPSPFGGPAGTYLLGTIAPIGVSGEDVFLWTLGRGPNPGEAFSTLTDSTTYLGAGLWDNGEPSLGVGESAFFTIPEPTTLALLGLGTLALVIARRWR